MQLKLSYQTIKKIKISFRKIVRKVQLPSIIFGYLRIESIITGHNIAEIYKFVK